MKKWTSAIVSFLMLVYCVLGNGVIATSVVKAAEIQPEVKVILPDAVYLGKSYDVQVVVENVSDLYGYSFDFVYDPKLIQLVEVNGGNVFDSKGTLAAELKKDFDNGIGSASYASTLTTRVPGVSEGGSLVTLRFKTVAEGTLPFEVTNSASEQLSLLAKTLKVMMTNSQEAPIEYSSTNAAITIVKDTIPSVVKGSNIADGAEGISTNPEFAVTYDETILSGANFSNITLIDMNNKPVAVNAAVQNNTLKVSPRGELENNLAYKLLIPAGAIQDEVNNATAADHVISFTTVKAKEDINTDGSIDIFDVVPVAKNYNMEDTNPAWAPKYDVQADGKINLLDLSAIVRRFVIQQAITITGIPEISAAVSQGSSYNLPAEVEVTMSDGSVRKVAVTWNPSAVDTTKPGTYIFEGKVKGYLSKARLILNVTARDANDIITFKSSNLEGAVRNQIGNWSNPILRSQVETITSLYAGYQPISDLSGIENLVNLENLGLDDIGVQDISLLSQLTKLKELQLWKNSIVDISPLSNLTNLEILSLSCNQITDISALRNLKNLAYLYIDENKISDISSLNALTNLINLSISFNEITNVSALSGLTKLFYLWASNNRISDLSALSSLTNLHHLDLGFNGIANISALSELTGLAELYLYSNEITDISPLSSLINLYSLELSNNQIGNISFLSGLGRLGGLYLSNNKISDISALNTLNRLERLSLASNEITDFTALKSLTNLYYLDLAATNINDFSLLQNMTRLDYLNLSSNHITDISGLGNLSNLTTLGWLVLNNNEITDITPLLSFTNLIGLELSNNQISDISTIGSLTGIRDIDLSNNHIVNIDVLGNILYLHGLNIRDNQITDVAVLSTTTVEMLYLVNNPISDYSVLSGIYPKLWRCDFNPDGTAKAIQEPWISTYYY